MILCFIAWIYIFIIGLLYSIPILSIFLSKRDAINFSIIQPFISSFIGVLFISNIALTLAIFVPLRAYHLIILSIVIIIYTVVSLKKEDLIEILIGASRYIIISSILTFFIINIPYSNISDMGIYHVQIAKYLHDYGLVKGLSLILLQLGHQSAWFALPALFEDFLKIYSSLIAGTFSIFISLCQFLKSLSKSLEDSDEIYLASYFLLTLPNLHVHIEVTSVEAALNALVGMTSFCSAKYLDCLPKRALKEKKIESNHFFLWPALILAVSSLSLKLSGIPIFLLSIFLFIKSIHFFKISQYIYFLFILFFFLTPKTIASFITSGCPFYPSNFLHASVPWYIGSDVSENLIQHIIDYGRWDTLHPPTYKTAINWILPWLQRYTGKSVLYITYILVITLLISISIFRKKFLSTYSHLLPLAIFFISGILYAFLTAPAPRFILFYFAGLVAITHLALSKIDPRATLLIAITTFSFTDLVNGNLKPGILQLLMLLLAIALDYVSQSKYLNLLTTTIVYINKIISFLLYYICLSIFSYPSFHLLLTPNTFSLIRDFEKIYINGITFYQPVKSTCGYGPLPCYSGNLPFSPPITEIELINKDQGVAGGFKRKPK